MLHLRIWALVVIMLSGVWIKVWISVMWVRVMMRGSRSHPVPRTAHNCNCSDLSSCDSSSDRIEPSFPHFHYLTISIVPLFSSRAASILPLRRGICLGETARRLGSHTFCSC